MRCIRNDLLHDVLNLCKLIHEVYLVMKSSCSVNNDNICIVGNSRTKGIESNRGRVSAHSLFYNRYSYSSSPYVKLLNGSSAECICSAKVHLLTCFLELVSQFSYCSSLAYTVYANHHYDIWL